MFCNCKKKNIAVLEVNGIISASSSKCSLSKGFSLMNTLEFLSKLEDEKQPLHGILLRLNTPGGTAVASEELARSIERIKKSREVPVVASIADVCCSGGYMVASVADKIFANRQSLTGSIGTILQVPNYQELAENIGVKMITIKSGKMKDIGNPMRPMEIDEREYLDDLAARGHQMFKDFVIRRRPGIVNGDEMMDGRPTDAPTAKANHLIDAFGTYLDAYDALLRLAQIDKKEPVKVLRIKEKKGILQKVLGTVAMPSIAEMAEDMMMQERVFKG